MNTELETLVPDNLFLRFDLLTLDIGSISLDSLEKELEEKLIAALRSELRMQIRLVEEKKAAAGDQLIQEDISGDEILLEHFLLHGSLPWWRSGAGFSADEIVDRLYRQNPEAIRALVTRLGRYEYIRRRLVFQLHTPGIQQIIEVLEPVEAAFIFGYHQQLVKVQAEEQVVQTETAVFEKEAWFFILTYLLDDRGSEFNRKSFVKSTLQKMAANFNVEYTGLLQLFYEAFRQLARDESVISSLESVIHELAIEAELQDRDDAFNTPLQDAETDDLLQGLELLRYYFQYGSLPATAAGMSRENMVQVWETLAEKSPLALQQSLAPFAGLDIFAGRLYLLAGQEKGNALLAAVFPGTARLLLMLGNVIELLQSKGRLPQMDMQVVKQYIIHQLFSAGNELRADMLLEKTIHALLLQYDYPRQSWLTALHEGIRSEFRQGIIYSQLPQLVQALHERAAPDPAIQVKPIVEAEMADTETERSVYDLLMHIISYGYLPWWGREMMENTRPQVLFLQLLSSSPQQALQLVRFSGVVSARRQRLLIWLPVHAWKDIWQLLPPGEEIITTFDEIMNRLPAALRTQKDLAETILLRSLWEELALYQYHDFSVTGLYTRFIGQLAEQTGRDIPRLALQFLHASNEVTEAAAALMARQTLSEIARQSPYIPEAGDADTFVSYMMQRFAGILPAEWITAGGHKRQGKKDSALQTFFQTATEPVRQMVARETEELLRYYITWNRLPDRIAVSGKDATAMFAARLFKLAYAIDPARLASLIHIQVQDEGQRKYFASLFNSSKGGMEAELYRLLMHPLKISYTTPLQEQQISRPPDRVLSDTMSHISGKEELRGEEALSVLSDALVYFFTTGHLPDAWLVSETAPSGQLLKNAFMLLYEQRKPFLFRLLQDRLHVPAARILFHDLFREHAGGKEKEIALFLQPYKEEYQQQLAKLSSIPSPPADIPVTETVLAEDEQLPGILHDFMQKGALPPGFTEAGMMDAIRRLYRKDPRLLESILTDARYTPQQRFLLYHTFIAMQQYSDRQLLRLFETHWEKDIQSLVRKGDDIESETGLLSIQTLLEITGEDNLPQDNIFAQSPLLIARLWDAGETGMLKQVLQKSDRGWGEDTIRQLFAVSSLLESAVQGRLEKERIALLLRRFHVQYISGSIHLQGFEAYLRALLTFLNEMPGGMQAGFFTRLAELARQQGAAVLPAAGISALEMQARYMAAYTARPGIQAERRVTASSAGDTQQEMERKKRQEQHLLEEAERKRREEEMLRKESEEMQKDKRNKIYIRNAGLVLFHPFLSTYFTRLGLMENGKFIHETAQYRAVVLLQYLAYGRIETEEFELPLNKILCGLPVDEPVPAAIEISEQEAAISEELFGVIFQRWDKMKNTSVAGFRASFIQREGALQRNEDTWELKVEQRAYDLLLSTLPWGISMIRCAWMNQLLTVEWT